MLVGQLDTLLFQCLRMHFEKDFVFKRKSKLNIPKFLLDTFCGLNENVQAGGGRKTGNIVTYVYFKNNYARCACEYMK